MYLAERRRPTSHGLRGDFRGLGQAQDEVGANRQLQHVEQGLVDINFARGEVNGRVGHAKGGDASWIAVLGVDVCVDVEDAARDCPGSRPLGDSAYSGQSPFSFLAEGEVERIADAEGASQHHGNQGGASGQADQAAPVVNQVALDERQKMHG